MTLSDGIAIAQTALAVGAFIFAYFELNRWRKELIGGKKIEVAIQLGKAALKIRDSFVSARSPFGYGELKEDFEHRRKILVEAIQPIYEIALEAEILFNIDIGTHIKAYNSQFHKFNVAMRMILDGSARVDTRTLVYRTEEKDEFEKEVERITDEILNIVRKHV